VIGQAREYIDKHYMEPNLSLYEVASQVNLSSSHFSAVFSQGTCQTFKEYLTTTRINKAKEMLRGSSLSSNDIAYQVGFNDPHYFSYVFKKNTGFSRLNSGHRAGQASGHEKSIFKHTSRLATNCKDEPNHIF